MAKGIVSFGREHFQRFRKENVQIDTFRKMFGGIKVRALIRGAHLQEPSNIE